MVGSRKKDNQIGGTLTTSGQRRIRERIRSRSTPSTALNSDTDLSDPGSHPERKRFRPDIEGLRGVAVLAVVLFHCSAPGAGGGFVGVDVFFVISGFLITGLLWREASEAGNVRLGRFYGARARRLLPASATVGVFTAIASVLLLPPLAAKALIGDGIASALYVGNYRFARQGVDYFHISKNTISPFQHYWSLGVEEQFYLVWPALIIGTAWLVRRARRRAAGGPATSSATPYILVLVLVGAVSFAMSLAATRAAPPVAFFSLHTRAWELAVGGLVALTTNQWRRLPAFPAAVAGWVGLALILLACSRFDATTPFPGTAALLPVIGAALVIGAGCAAASRGCGRVLALRPMRAVGRVSYSWYLWHWPVLLLAAPLLGRPMTPVDGLIALVVSFGLAVLTLRLIENPFRYAASVRRSAAHSLAVGGIATALAVCVGVALLLVVPTPVGRGPAAPALRVIAGPPPTGSNFAVYDAAVQQVFAQVQAAVAASVDLKAVPSNLDPPLVDAAHGKAPSGLEACLRNLLEVDQPDCATGDTASGTTVALVGDSNAFSWSPAFQQVATEQRWRLEVLTKGACPMLDLPLKIFVQRNYTECEQWRNHIVARLQSEHPRLVVLSMLRHDSGSGSPPYGHAWIDSLTRLVQQLRGTGANVLVLGPTPDLHSTAPDCLSQHLDDAAACSSARSAAVNQPGIEAERAATKTGGGQYADATELFCAASRCPAIVGNTLVYEDEFHLTPEYARLLAPAIGALAARTLISG
ncbi:acyltransferase [Mycobacterium intracellulare]|uniref:acyltransferase family protein n=1 Tax=Mycobacterium intracellulare TaxID=1767 RepID=UPI001CDA4A96|nr:acyltransferase family protein [Mycobacterium intracellulare]MCA2305807.1 acyltransferase [Mycobacterium intracellulare]MCA2347958.1 acyltransferase [Mycobacterium intracellulare]